TDSSTTDSSKMIPGPLGSNDDQPTNGNKGTFQEINSTVSKKNYPITGEQTSPLLIVVGGILLVFSFLLMRQTRKASK
ncbi:LPXTG cell wall anchor domain-containing protein, partial [Enterococcus hulanensis]|uniref:LPXTG cell wall anchor domain-containing protein n=1 Tax=Enterococcus hulanensis TaxID=2559929 RepID=UPI001A8C7F6F